MNPLDPMRLDFESFVFRQAPKLAILSIAAEPKLLKVTEMTNAHLVKVIATMHGQMHPQGTMAFVVPHPWREHFTRLQGEFTSSSL